MMTSKRLRGVNYGLSKQAHDALANITERHSYLSGAFLIRNALERVDEALVVTEKTVTTYKTYQLLLDLELQSKVKRLATFNRCSPRAVINHLAIGSEFFFDPYKN